MWIIQELPGKITGDETGNGGPNHDARIEQPLLDPNEYTEKREDGRKTLCY